MVKRAVAVLVFLFLLFSYGYGGDQGCRASFINPITDIKWYGIFPIELAGVEIRGFSDLYKHSASEGLQTNPDRLSSIMCACREGLNMRVGLTASYWEPARVLEVTKIPWCFPLLGGIQLNLSKSGKLHKATMSTGPSSYVSYNAHYYIFNVLDIIDLFVDIPCVPHEGFDVAYLSEVDPMWNNDVLSFVINPEAILFGNPIAQLACAADSAAAAVKYPIDALFWCVGSWGSAYPLAGSATEAVSHPQTSALIASKTLYRNARLGILWDPGIDECYAVLTPVWKKTSYKMHLVKPRQGPFVPLGRSQLLWEYFKNPPFGSSKNSPDNYAWIVFRRVKCCMGIRTTN